MIRRLFPAAVIACTIAVVVACGKSNPASPTSNGTTGTTVTGTGTGGGTGKLTVKLKDSPFSEAVAVYVRFTEMSVHTSDGTWKTIPFTQGAPLTCDLKELESALDLLGEATLAAGHYTQVRLTVESATIYMDDPEVATKPTKPTTTTTPCMVAPAAPTFVTAAPVNVPSGEVKIVREFDVPVGANVTMVLDFDGNKSINLLGNGKYQMSPVISVVSVQ